MAKAPFMEKIIGIAFRYFSWVIPVKKVYNSRDVIAFYHPKPSYKNHVVIVPKRAIANLQQLASDKFQEYFIHDVVNADWEIHTEIPAVSSGQITNEYFKDIMQRIDWLDVEFNIVKKGYSLVYQYEKKTRDLPKFHIVAGKKGETIK